MTICSVYVFPKYGGHFLDNAARFISSYNLNPPGLDHKLILISNGGSPTIEMRALADQLEYPVEWFEHDNTGYDFGAYQAIARTNPADIIVLFGASAYLRRPGWMVRVRDSVLKRGNAAIFGTMGNNGNAACGVFPHIRTTGFWLTPGMLNMYPLKVTDPSQRYPAEHGPNSLCEWARKQGYAVWVVGWSGEWLHPTWDSIPGGFHRGNQEDLLTGDRVSSPPYFHCA